MFYSIRCVCLVCACHASLPNRMCPHMAHVQFAAVGLGGFGLLVGVAYVQHISQVSFGTRAVFGLVVDDLLRLETAHTHR